MEDKEREMLYGLISQLSQANIQLTMTMMNMFGQMMMSKLGGNVGVGAFPLPPTVGFPGAHGGPSFGGLPLSEDFIKKMMKQFFPNTDDNEDLK